MKRFNRFDMEQEIMNCWNICEDMETLYEGVLDQGMTTDQISNTLMGLKQLYQLKFTKLWDSFEALCSEHTQVKISAVPDSEQVLRQLEEATNSAQEIVNSSTVTWEDHEPDQDSSVLARGEVL